LGSLQQFDNGNEIIDEIQFNELNEKVQSLLNELSPRQKEIFLLSREEGLTHDEIAKRLNISANTVKNHMVAALSFLKSNIDSKLIINLLFIHLFL
jgi:RNA polymerase sigma-70 factor (ECF subfamily)